MYWSDRLGQVMYGVLVAGVGRNVLGFGYCLEHRAKYGQKVKRIVARPYRGLPAPMAHPPVPVVGPPPFPACSMTTKTTFITLFMMPTTTLATALIKLTQLHLLRHPVRLNTVALGLVPVSRRPALRRALTRNLQNLYLVVTAMVNTRLNTVVRAMV